MDVTIWIHIYPCSLFFFLVDNVFPHFFITMAVVSEQEYKHVPMDLEHFNKQVNDLGARESKGLLGDPQS